MMNILKAGYDYNKKVLRLIQMLGRLSGSMPIVSRL